MCLGVPAKIEKIDGDIAQVNIGGILKEVNIMLVPEVKVGEYVIIHAGFAIQRLDEESAQETLNLLSQMEIIS